MHVFPSLDEIRDLIQLAKREDLHARRTVGSSVLVP